MKSICRPWRGVVAALALVVVGVVGTIDAALAQTADAAVPPPPTDVVEAKAYGALERVCARCHQSGRLEGRSAEAGIANILALEEIARDPGLVRPGEPDASRIYNIALTRELHHDQFNDPGVPEPLPLEVQALRDWISELPRSPGATCSSRPQVSRSRIDELVEAAALALPPERARQTRFLSLAHLYDICLPDRELEDLRAGVDALVASLVPPGTTVPAGGWITAADLPRLVASISLTALGWRPEQWEALTQSYPLRSARSGSSHVLAQVTGSRGAIVHADWFAHAAMAVKPDLAKGASRPLRWGLPQVAALAHVWRRPADLGRVVADLAMEQATVEKAMRAAPNDVGLAASQLLGGGVARRAELDRLYAVLTQGDVEAAGPRHHRLEIALAADKAIYKAGETATFTVTSSQVCFLTLVAVDRGGRATVLFPNELEPDNRIAAYQPVRIPGEVAPYRFRFKEKGREHVVAMCSATHKAPEGIVHDYERLRFTVLGDWQLFLRERPEMTEARRDDAATDVPRPQLKQRRRGRSTDPKVEAPASVPDVHTRTSISIQID